MVIFIFALAMLSALIIFLSRPFLSRMWLISITVVILSISCGWIPQQLMTPLAEIASSTALMKEKSAIVLLGAGLSTTTEGADAIPFHAYSRISKAAELYNQCNSAQRNCTLLISGGSPIGRPSEASEYAKVLVKLGIPASKIIMEEKSQNTWQNAQYSQPILSRFDSIFIVTNGLHARRTALYFRHFGIEPRVIASDQFPIQLNPWQWGLNWFVFEVEIHEWIGIARYHIYESLGLNKVKKETIKTSL